ncbi:MAG: hypothetical protein AAB884_00250 [Patescibacteria group bacterium]
MRIPSVILNWIFFLSIVFLLFWLGSFFSKHFVRLSSRWFYKSLRWLRGPQPIVSSITFRIRSKDDGENWEAVPGDDLNEKQVDCMVGIFRELEERNGRIDDLLRGVGLSIGEVGRVSNLQIRTRFDKSGEIVFEVMTEIHKGIPSPQQ